MKCYFRCQVCHKQFSSKFKDEDAPKRFNKPTGKVLCCGKPMIYERKGEDYRSHNQPQG